MHGQLSIVEQNGEKCFHFIVQSLNYNVLTLYFIYNYVCVLRYQMHSECEELGRHFTKEPLITNVVQVDLYMERLCPMTHNTA